MRVDASVVEAELPASNLLQKERANPFAIERAGRVVADAGIGEEVCEVVPQSELRVMSVGVLEALDRRDGFDTLDQRLEPIDARGQAGIGASNGDASGKHNASGYEGQRHERAAQGEPGHAWLLERAAARVSAGGRADEVVGFCCVADGSIRRTPPFS